MRLSAPKPDVVEVSIFGPGFGECVLVHLGGGDWMIVDSCLDQRRGVQPALAHLDAMGIDPATAVVAVLATHWHGDHVRGLSEVVARCINAEFWLSQAVHSKDLLRITRRLCA